jgi:ankyrin repeat protein
VQNLIIIIFIMRTSLWATGDIYDPAHQRDDQRRTPLMLCIIEKPFVGFAHMDHLINSGAHLNLSDKSKNTVLHYAVIHAVGLEYLLSHKYIKVNEKNKDGDTPLMIAAKNDDNVSLGLLLKAFADADLENNRGMRAYDMAKNPENKLLIWGYMR